MQKKIYKYTFYLNLINCFCMVTTSHIFKRIIHLKLFESISGSLDYPCVFIIIISIFFLYIILYNMLLR